MVIVRSVVLNVGVLYDRSCYLANMNTQTTRRPRADGERSRHAILDAAARLATVEGLNGLSIGGAEVVEPAAAAPAGLPRVWALTNEFLGHLERGVFPGGCFFASVAAEIDTRPGRVRDRIVEFIENWVGEILRAVEDAQAAGEIDEAEDAGQLTFEIDAMLLMANAAYVLDPSPEVLERGRRGVAKLIGPDPAR
jgi:AcrR family transcriptional regulator